MQKIIPLEQVACATGWLSTQDDLSSESGQHVRVLIEYIAALKGTLEEIAGAHGREASSPRMLAADALEGRFSVGSSAALSTSSEHAPKPLYRLSQLIETAQDAISKEGDTAMVTIKATTLLATSCFASEEIRRQRHLLGPENGSKKRSPGLNYPECLNELCTCGKRYGDHPAQAPYWPCQLKATDNGKDQPT